MPQNFVKDPDATIDFDIDWSDWLLTGDAVQLSGWEITPTTSPALAVDSAALSANVAKVWLSGGKAGELYTVTNTVTTSEGRTDERSIYVSVQER